MSRQNIWDGYNHTRRWGRVLTSDGGHGYRTLRVHVANPALTHKQRAWLWNAPTYALTLAVAGAIVGIAGGVSGSPVLYCGVLVVVVLLGGFIVKDARLKVGLPRPSVRAFVWPDGPIHPDEDRDPRARLGVSVDIDMITYLDLVATYTAAGLLSDTDFDAAHRAVWAYLSQVPDVRALLGGDAVMGQLGDLIDHAAEAARAQTGDGEKAIG